MNEQELKIKDSRRFNPDGSPRDEGTVASGEPQEDSPQSEAPDSREGDVSTEPGAAQTDQQIPGDDFSGFLLSLAQSALIDLGSVPHPESGDVALNLSQARHTIDLLGMLKEKTEGNLSEEELKLVEGLLYQLRLIFIQAQEQ
jgi:hypothetical protein